MYRPWEEDSSAMFGILVLILVEQSKRYTLGVMGWPFEFMEKEIFFPKIRLNVGVV